MKIKHTTFEPTRNFSSKVKVTSPLNRPHTSRRGAQVQLYSSPALDEGGWSVTRPGRFTSGKETRYPLYRRLCGPEGAENLPPTGI